MAVPTTADDSGSAGEVDVVSVRRRQSDYPDRFQTQDFVVRLAVEIGNTGLDDVRSGDRTGRLVLAAMPISL